MALSIFRSSVTGRFITEEDAQANPNETSEEVNTPHEIIDKANAYDDCMKLLVERYGDMPDTLNRMITSGKLVYMPNGV